MAKTYLIKNRAFALILTLTLIISICSPVFSQEDTLKYDIYTYTLSNGTITITGVDDVAGVVNVPNKIDGNIVTSIGDGAFGGSSKITEVHIPESVTKIGSMCFAYSGGITTVYLSSSVTSIPDGAFYQCTSLGSVSIAYGTTSIGSKAFALCPNLTSITIPNSMKKIADDAFLDTENVTFHCYLGENAVGYSFAQSKDIACEELITVYVNNKEIAFDQPPITEKKKFRTLVPLRAVLEYMGAEIEWYNDMNYAGIDIGDNRILIKPGSEFMMVNGKAVTLSCPALEYNNRVLLPIRDVVVAVGGKVAWDEYNKTVNITYNN